MATPVAYIRKMLIHKGDPTLISLIPCYLSTTATLTLMKLPPHISDTSLGLVTVPRVSPILKATSMVRRLYGRLCIWTQNKVVLKISSWAGVEPSYLCSATKCLSKAHGSPCSTFSASTSRSKTIRSTLFPASLTLNLLHHRVCNIGWNVLTTASMFSDRHVKNYTARTISVFFLYPDKSLNSINCDSCLLLIVQLRILVLHVLIPCTKFLKPIAITKTAAKNTPVNVSWQAPYRFPRS